MFQISSLRTFLGRIDPAGTRVVIAVLLILQLPSCRTATIPPPPHVAASFERSLQICRDIEKIRGLAFKKEVAIRVQSIEEFRTYVKKSITRQFGGDEEIKSYVKGLVKLGVLKSPIDLTSTIMGLAESQVAAHYDLKNKEYCLLMTDMPEDFLDTISSHELFHALQDQHFNLYAFLEGDIQALRNNGDSILARQCLVEGEATLVMTVWMLMRQMGMDDPKSAEFMASMGIGIQAGLDLDEIIAASETQFAILGAPSESMANAVKELKNLPRFLVEPMFASYLQGALMVDHIKSQGGWDAVEALYRDPPQSTEQVLHPRKLIGRRDVPVDVRLPLLIKRLPDKWRLLEQDVLGELGTRIFFRLWQTEETKDSSAAASAAAGWGGDRYYYFADSDTGRDLLVWKTVWDSPGEAAEFVVAYRMTLASRFPDRRKAWQSNPGNLFVYQVWEVEPGRFLKLMRKNEIVGIMDTTDRAVLDVLWK